MPRIAFALAAGTVCMLTLSSSAEACISCEYVPEVVRNHTTDSPRSRPQRTYTETREHKRSKKVTEREPTSRKKVVTEREQAPRKKVVTEREQAPAKKQVVSRQPAASEPAAANEHSSITASEAKSDRAVTSTAAIPPVKSGTETEHSTISTADGGSRNGTDVATGAQPVSEAAEHSVGCKKFFPTVGMTLSVPCE